MAKSSDLVTLVTLTIAATLLGHASAGTYIVGDTELWTFPSSATAYATWASQYTFVVGDVLVFNFATGSHTVATVTKESFDTCNTNNPISLITNGPASITLTSAGETYFICTVPQHCSSASQKLAINVTASSASPPPSSPSPPPSIEPTPSPLPETPSPAASPPALGPGGPAPTGSVIPPSSPASPPALGPGGPAPTGLVSPDVPPTSSVSPPPPQPEGSPPPPSSVEDVPPPSPPPPSGATRTGLASISAIFISAALCLLF